MARKVERLCNTYIVKQNFVYPISTKFQRSEKPWVFKKTFKKPTHWVLLGFWLYWVFGYIYLNEQLGAHQLSFI